MTKEMMTNTFKIDILFYLSQNVLSIHPHQSGLSLNTWLGRVGTSLVAFMTSQRACFYERCVLMCTRTRPLSLWREAGRRSEGWADTLDVTTVMQIGKPLFSEKRLVADLFTIVVIIVVLFLAFGLHLCWNQSCATCHGHWPFGSTHFVSFFFTPSDVIVCTTRPQSTWAN